MTERIGQEWSLVKSPLQYLQEAVAEAIGSSVTDPSLAASLTDRVVAKVEPMMDLLRMYHSQEVDLASGALSQATAASEACEIAWGIIANAGGGDWTLESEEWQKAAARWRDEHWHPLLRDTSSRWTEDEDVS